MNLVVVVVRHADRATQCDLVRRIAADHRVFHVEVGVHDRRLYAAKVRDAPRGVLRLELVSIQHLGDQVRRDDDVVKLAPLERQ